jgi:amino acid transporter
VPLIPLVAVLLLVLALILAMPLSLVLRYRAGRARRFGRRWVATLNLVMIVFSAVLFLYVAAITSFWIPGAFRYSLFGLMGGCLLGLLGLALTGWEETPRALHYTPNRWLGLANLACMAGVRVRNVVAGGGGCSRFPGSRSHRARLLRHLLSGRPVAT